MSVAFVFPGQGSQEVGMGQALALAFPESRAVFEEADAALGFALSRLCFEGPEGDLQLTANTQPAILAASVAALRPLAARGARPQWVAGHSLGEYSALVAAGSLTLGDALRTVRRRGELMQEAVPVGVGAMAAILGLDLPGIEDACREAARGEVVAPANVNSPGQVVIAGHAGAVERASDLCRARGAKRAIRLPVSAPFHCALMQPAQDALAPVVTLAPFRPVEQGGPPTLRPRLLGFLVFGIVASVGGSGVNVLLRLVTRGGAGTLDLLAWVLFTFPIALAVWMLPPRGLGINEGAGDQRKGGNNRPVGSESPQGP